MIGLPTDDQDVNQNVFEMYRANDGDYHLTMHFKDPEEKRRSESVRVCMSGGYCPTEVKTALHSLFKAMQKNGMAEW